MEPFTQNLLHPRNDWCRFFKLLFLRTIDPISSVRFIFYFFVIVVGVGGIGFWINFLQDSCEIQIYYSVSTFALTLAAASFADVTLNNNKSSSDICKESVPEILVFPYTCFFLITSATAVLGLILCGFELGNKIGYLSEDLGITCSQIALALSLFFWWQVNSKNPQLSKQQTSPQNSYGNTEQIDENATNGFKVS